MRFAVAAQPLRDLKRRRPRCAGHQHCELLAAESRADVDDADRAADDLDQFAEHAVAVQVAAEPAAPKPGDTVAVTLTLINAGAGHKLPTGDPDRHFTVEFEVRDPQGTVVADQRDTMGRWIMWQPVIVEVYDNRLMPLASRAYRFTYRLPEREAGLSLRTRVRYHIQSEAQHTMLIKKYGLTAPDPYAFDIYERDLPLSPALGAALTNQPASGPLACAASPAGHLKRNS